jgi:hypothetical protein
MGLGITQRRFTPRMNYPDLRPGLIQPNANKSRPFVPSNKDFSTIPSELMTSSGVPTWHAPPELETEFLCTPCVGFSEFSNNSDVHSLHNLGAQNTQKSTQTRNSIYSCKEER